MALNTFQKNAVFAAGVVVLTGILCMGGLIGFSEFKTCRAHQKIVDARARVERVMHLSRCAKFTDAEKARLDALSLDPEGTKNLLLAIHRERFANWNQACDIAKKRCDKFWELRDVQKLRPAWADAMADYKNASEQLTIFADALEAISAHDVTAPLVKTTK